MKKAAILLSLSLFAWLPQQPAYAKGCIKGALVGGVVGHYAGHHGVLGAVAGCLYGRHEAHKYARRPQPSGGWTTQAGHSPRSWKAGT
ncbi:hypothetical protein OGR47_07925 [Methylocystis sp. MJC1]|uniref:hypothetical protein n=1 Tax=Methylocystis sp. MJC1 TaxID=2654282 RepID=UPI0013EC85C9|nr:hypothetical protein [Methylocystis sp. MJC1]KAF2989190.1 hypothetical protein MJC1_03660 [Methylocystis sp. MJC1]MBU6526919.1 hypothetical protein [Methylocystis sp. MJC1]UZX13355.1 hypothetical protein OGR47_07925 [Methylocystis sp. MJC1]